MVDIGSCKLTGRPGKFVKSHLLPRAFTRLSGIGEKAYEVHAGKAGFIRRAEGWYDLELVTEDGEKLLAKYDTEGIRELRRLGLVWSSATRLASKDTAIQTAIPVHSNHPKHLRMFILSLLWRAASTQIPAFDHFEYPATECDYLGELLLKEHTGVPNEFLTVFIILDGDGAVHNHTPSRQELTWKGKSIPYVRFYFDGLVVHIYDRGVTQDFVTEVGQAAAGFAKDFIVVRRPFDDSKEREDLLEIMLKPEVFEHMTKVRNALPSTFSILPARGERVRDKDG